jgi:hypothetical protein
MVAEMAPERRSASYGNRAKEKGNDSIKTENAIEHRTEKHVLGLDPRM